MRLWETFHIQTINSAQCQEMDHRSITPGCPSSEKSITSSEQSHTAPAPQNHHIISAAFGQGPAFTKCLPPCVRTGGTGSRLHQMEQVHELSSSERNSSCCLERADKWEAGQCAGLWKVLHCLSRRPLEAGGALAPFLE